VPNRLIHETSPYLRQHAHNPVDWYPWGEEAFRRAKEEDKPILLSIGYSACHWCHVMERESFQDPEIARIMNENFVNVKVDREERPDVDAIYMQAVQAMTGSGGWPLTVFLTPDGEPFFGGTYFPPQDRHGLPGFPKVLLAVAEAYRSRRQEVRQQAAQMATYIRRVMALRSPPDLLTPQVLDEAFRNLEAQYDAQFGGIGPAPKFPQVMAWEFLLRYHLRTGQPQALEMVTRTLQAMASGGIHDHLGGGFHRYSVDRLWLVPHFEKMLYDNALLASLYLHAFQLTGQEGWAQVVRSTLDCLLREMRHPQGAFYSSQDADSEGQEGRFYTWTYDEVMEALGPQMGRAFALRYGLTPEGNFEGRNVLYLARSLEEVAQEMGLEASVVGGMLEEARARLLAIRERRPRPERDEKVLTGWNGLALAALSEASCVLKEPRYREAAVECARFLLAHLLCDGQLMHSYKDGQAKVPAYLEDYACLVHGLLLLHEATFDVGWLREAVALARQMVSMFWEPQEGVFYDTGPLHHPPITRPREVLDGATPSGSSMATYVLLRLSAIVGEEELRNIAIQALRGMRELMVRAPAMAGQWLCALDLSLADVQEVAVVGQRHDPRTQAMLDVLYSHFQPHRVVVGMSPEEAGTGIPLLEGKTALGGEPTAYVCRHFVCREPVTSPQDLARQLSQP
jgi:uncharacterized protein YyaL (SSP411 family)